MANEKIFIADKATLDLVKDDTTNLINKATSIDENLIELKKNMEDGAGKGGTSLLNVTTETNSFIGKTVTLIGDAGEKTAIFSEEMKCKFNVEYIGDYTITCEGYESHISISEMSKIYSATVDEHYSSVTVSTSSDEFLLATVVCIDSLTNQIVDTQVFNVGKTAVFRIMESGSYYFKVTYEGKDYKSKIVSITENDILEDKEFSAKVNYILIYGFVEDFSVLDPESRITYCDENENYTPMTLKSDGSQDYGGWVDWELLVENLPYMVRSDGTADYQLDPNDYSKKASGGSSDVSNASYTGGAFSWLKKVYVKETYDSSRSKRTVQFAFSNTTADTADFEAYAFKYDENTELDGLWLPMFYMDANGKTISGTQPVYSKTTEEERSLIRGFSSRACHLGGPVMNLLRDLAYLLTKSTDIQSHWGEGCMNAYNSNSSPTYGVKKNAIVNGGQFYGCTGGNTLNKAFHSIVIQSFQQYLRDPMTLLSNGKMLVSKYYNLYSLTGSGYYDTGYSYSGNGYSSKLQPVSGFGSVHTTDFNGSTSTGSCDYQYYNNSGVHVALRLGSCNVGLSGGPSSLNLNSVASNSSWIYGVGVLLCPSAGYAPA